MSKKLVAYFTISGQTKNAAEEIAKLLNCDTYEIKPKIKYKSEDLVWGPCRSQTECKDRTIRPELADKNSNIKNYDTILIGFPVWCLVAPNVILTFLEAYDFRGKTVIIWGTSWKSLMGNIMEEMKHIVKGANVIEGVIFDQNHKLLVPYIADDINIVLKNLPGKLTSFVGDGAALHKAVLYGEISNDNNIHAKNIGICAYNKFKQGNIETADSIVPMYLRKSQAERMKDLK